MNLDVPEEHPWTIRDADTDDVVLSGGVVAVDGDTAIEIAVADGLLPADGSYVAVQE